MDFEQIQKLWWTSPPLSENISDTIYHYTDIDTTLKILSDNSVCFHLTKAEDFQDKFEGKTIEVYYDLALYNLKSSGFLRNQDYEILSDISVSDKREMFFDCPSQEAHSEYKPTRYKTYIACFSMDKNSTYMINNYIKQNDRKGYCLELSSVELNDYNTTTRSFGKGHQFVFKKILYGSQIISYFEKFIKWLYSFAPEPAEEDIAKVFIPRIKEELSQLRFTSKLSRYEKENEARLILYMPYPDDSPDYYVPQYTEEVNEHGKHFINIELPKQVLFNLFPSDSVGIEEHQHIINQLSKTGYRLI